MTVSRSQWEGVILSKQIKHLPESGGRGKLKIFLAGFISEGDGCEGGCESEIGGEAGGELILRALDVIWGWGWVKVGDG